jgi:succinoglycan biosynthesis protein ExoO
MSLVTVIIPAYNTERYIKTCIQSVLDQTYDNFEIIIVDDYSTDHSLEIIRQFDDPRIRVIKNDKNRGPSYSRNYAIQLAKGEFIAILDSDDWWEPNRLERMMSFINETNADMLFDDVLYIREGEKEPWTTYSKFKGFILDEPTEVSLEYFVNNDLGILKAIIRKQLIEDHSIYYDESIKYGEDFLFYLQLISKTKKVWLINESYYYYLSREGSLVQDMYVLSKECLRATEELLTKPKAEFTSNLVKALEKRKHDLTFVVKYHETDQYLKTGAFNKAVKNFIDYPTILKEMVLVRLRLLKYSLFAQKNRQGR